MPKLSVYNISGQPTGEEIELNDQEVMDRLDAAFDYDERVKCFVDAEQILTEDCPSIFLYANDNITLVNTDKVKDVTVFPIDYYMITGKWKAAE